MTRKDGLAIVNAGVQYRQALAENDEHFVNAVNTPEPMIPMKHLSRQSTGPRMRLLIPSFAWGNAWSR
jgi:hypothetical protein